MDKTERDKIKMQNQTNQQKKVRRIKGRRKGNNLKHTQSAAYNKKRDNAYAGRLIETVIKCKGGRC